MKLPIAVAGAALAAAPAFAAPASVAGRWLTQGGKAVVEVAPCTENKGGAQLCGRIVRIVRPEPGKPLNDAHNPDKAQRARAILGIPILAGFVAADDHWKGSIYDPQSGRTYRAELRRDGNTLKVKGCFGPFCRTQDWSKAG